MDFERLHSKNAEANTLGSIIVGEAEGQHTLSKVMCIIPDTDAFFARENEIIYDALLRMFIDRTAIDGSTLYNWLEQHGKLEKVGGAEYIRKILDNVPSAANAEYYAHVVAEKQQYRQIVQLVQEIQTLIDNNALPPKEMSAEIQKLVLSQKIIETQTYINAPIQEGLHSILHHTEAVLETGYRDLDRRLQGFAVGDLVIVAGRPSMGKSSLMINILTNMALAGKKGLLVTLEVKPEKVAARQIAREAKVNMKMFSDADKKRLRDAADKLDGLSIWMSDRADTPEAITALVHRVKQTHGLDVVVVDYLQLMRGIKPTNSRNNDLADISRSLKKIAVSEDVVMMVGSQLNRDCERRTDRKPRLSDLRDSGAIEQDADAVLLLYRPEYYEPDNESVKGYAEVNCAKVRDGETGIIKMTFLKEITSFENYYGAEG